MVRLVWVASIDIALAMIAGACAPPAAAPAAAPISVAQVSPPVTAPAPPAATIALPARPLDPPAVLTGDGELHKQPGGRGTKEEATLSPRRRVTPTLHAHWARVLDAVATSVIR